MKSANASAKSKGPRSKPLASGVFAFEGDPEVDLRERYSVRPVLQFLNDLEGLKYIFRDIGTPEELEFYVKKWTQAKYSEYQVGYFSFHGSPGALWFPDSRKSGISLDDLADWIDGRAEGRIIHFGACSVMRLGDRRLREFLETTGARAVTGYRTDVDWLEAMAFDALMLGALWLLQADQLCEKIPAQDRRRPVESPRGSDPPLIPACISSITVG